VFENRVLRRIFGTKREEVAGGWRRLHNEELHNLYTSANIIRVIKSKRTRLAGQVARMDITEMQRIFLLENLNGRNYLEDIGVDGNIILKWLLRK
jgi:hypothetical protein